MLRIAPLPHHNTLGLADNCCYYKSPISSWEPHCTEVYIRPSLWAHGSSLFIKYNLLTLPHTPTPFASFHKMFWQCFKYCSLNAVLRIQEPALTKCPYLSKHLDFSPQIPSLTSVSVKQVVSDGKKVFLSPCCSLLTLKAESIIQT